MTATNDRLSELLEDREEQIAGLKEQVSGLQNQLNGIKHGWTAHGEIPDDGALPVPRLEVACIQVDEWHEYRVVYRLVYKHLMGHLVTVPLGVTRISGAANQAPTEDELPYRDFARAAHDAAHLGLPVYKLMPGEAPVRLDMRAYGPHQDKLGREHRREAT